MSTTSTEAPVQIQETSTPPEEIHSFAPFKYAGILSQGAPFADWRDDLARDGYAVVRGAVPRERALEYRDRAKHWLKERSGESGFSWDKPETWTADKMPIHIVGGMFLNYGISHEDWVWGSRTEPGVLGAFEKFWGTSELLTSMDAATIMLPGRSDLPATPPWPHMDQSQCRRGFYILQGLVNLNECGDNDGGLMALRGSHNLVQDYFDEHGRGEDRSWGPVDSYSFTRDQEEWFEARGCEWVKVNAKPGDLVLWDSRTMHYSVMPKGDKPRICVYVCQSPKELATESDLSLLRKAYEEKLRTTHVTFGGHVWTRPQTQTRPDTGKPDPLDTGKSLSPAPETERMLQLVGIKPYEV